MVRSGLNSNSIKSMLTNITDMSKDFITAAEELYKDLCMRSTSIIGFNGVRPEDDPTSIGNILIEMGFIDSVDLTLMVNDFKRSKDKMLGEYLVKHTSLTVKQLEAALACQRDMRKTIISE